MWLGMKFFSTLLLWNLQPNEGNRYWTDITKRSDKYIIAKLEMLCKFKNTVLGGITQGEKLYQGSGKAALKRTFLMDSEKTLVVSQVKEGKRESIPSREKNGPEGLEEKRGWHV